MNGLPLHEHALLLAALRAYSGRRLLGVVDGGDCVELVFEDESQTNLVSLFTGSRIGLVAFGGVSDPVGYVAGRWRPEMTRPPVGLAPAAAPTSSRRERGRQP
jgi:hypothetical protein